MPYANSLIRRTHNQDTGYAATKKYQRTAKGRAAKHRAYLTQAAKGANRRGNLLRCYGLTVEAWNALFDKQDHRCAVPVCRSLTPGSALGWHTHHIERDGRKVIIGILCHHCNHALTRHMTPEWLRGLADFMETYHD